MEFASPDQADHYFLKIVIDPSNYFKREGLDVITEADVSVAQALLGGQLQIRGLTHDKVRIDLSSFIIWEIVGIFLNFQFVSLNLEAIKKVFGP